MAELRKGRQTPTQSVILPYSKTRGSEAIKLYNSTGRRPVPMTFHRIMQYTAMR